MDETRLAGGAAAVRPDSSIFRFATADYAPRDRLDAWREVYGKTLCKQEIEPTDPDCLDANVEFRRLPGLATMRGDLFQALYRRKPYQVESDRLFVTVGLAGSFEVEQLGRNAHVRTGDGFIGTGAEPLFSRVSAGCRSLTLSIPARAIAPMVPALDTMFGRALPAESPALRMMARYIGFLEGSGELAIAELQSAVVKHVHDLVALALGASRDAAVAAQLGGGRAARLREIKADIERAIGHEEISIDRLSARHRLPVRYIQRLFETDGVTFTEFVLAKRLAWAHRMLTDRRFIDLPIIAIASQAGFNNQSYFNRSFRNCYGASPSEVRAGEGPAAGRPVG